MSKQTASEFVQLAFAIVGDQQWSISSYGVIRNEKNECPICAVHNKLNPHKRYDNYQFESAAGAMKLNYYIAGRIANAADGQGGTIRGMLLNALVKKS